MSFLKKEGKAGVCSKTDKIINSARNKRWPWWLFPFTGLAALIWFLVRVIPKPSRAAYPCQRVAFPLASCFIVWLLGMAGSVAAFRKAKRALVRTRYVAAAICIVFSVASIYLSIGYTSQDKVLARTPQPVNAPIGIAKGIHPGRVAWIHDANATNWLGSYEIQGVRDGYWWEPNHTDQNVVNSMVSKSLRAMTGKSTNYAAWDSIFHYFNQHHGKGNVGYQAGEKIMIKVNQVGLIDSATHGNYAFRDNYPNTSGQVMHAVLDQLVNVVGVDDNCITIGETLGTFTDDYYNPLHADFPDVNYIDMHGNNGRGKTATPSTNPRVYWADANSNSAVNKDYVPNAYHNASYLINLANLKGHYNQAGVTMCGKNHYGSMCRTPDASGYYNLHTKQVALVPGMGHYRPLVDLMGHPEIGGKTVLFLIDGLYPNKHAQHWPTDFPFKWQTAPFNNDWASSFFASQDPVAIDSVGFDFIYNEWPNEWPGTEGTDDYLHEAASIPNPPSGTIYDPNNDGGLTKSLGVHEHWNNATDMQYTRNLGTGSGIELATATPGNADFNGDLQVDFKDFARFANAWGSETGDPDWDPNCDISSIPGDGVIDEKDLAVFCDNWQARLTSELVMPGATMQQVYYDASYNFEGPTWDPISSKLFFTKRPRSSGTYQILRLDSPGIATVWMTPSPQTNGTILSLDGRLLTADESTMQIRSHRIGASGPEDTVVLCTAPDKPNDLCQLTNGNIYFTCPDWSSTTYQGVYLLKPDGSVTRVNNALNQPNGIITSLDETKLYVAESSSSDLTKKRWWVFPINTDGTLGTGSVFFKPTDTTGMGTSDPDGMTIDEFGNLYFTGLGGVWIVSPAGKELKRIPTPDIPANICFGGLDNRTLYIACNYRVYSLAMVVHGGE